MKVEARPAPPTARSLPGCSFSLATSSLTPSVASLALPSTVSLLPVGLARDPVGRTGVADQRDGLVLARLNAEGLCLLDRLRQRLRDLRNVGSELLHEVGDDRVHVPAHDRVGVRVDVPAG